MKKIIISGLVFLGCIGLVWYLEQCQIITWRLTLPKASSVVQEEPAVATSTIAVHFLDIGQGDATLLVMPDQTEVLVDCARDGIILPALSRVRAWNDRTLDYLIVTHPDSDHFGGCIDVLQQYQVNHILLTGFQKNGGGLWAAFMKQASAETNAQIERVTSTQSLPFSSGQWEILYPNHDVSRDPRIPSTSVVESNDTSIVLKVTGAKNSVLLTGDMEAPLEHYLVTARGEQLQSTILKVGHHGSDSSSSQEFLDQVRPQTCVISAGKNNSYGHPTTRVLKRLERTGCQILRTDVSGDISLTL